jgi:hypothetical protein
MELAYRALMNKPILAPESTKLTLAQPTLAEEQRHAFETDRARRPRSILSIRFPNPLLRN